MNNDKTISNMQKKFVYLINRLHALGKPVPNEVSNNRVLRCLSRNWQPKVTTIKDANDLTTLNLTTLFGKLEEHQQELMTLDIVWEEDKERKTHGED
jgi:hypothetical protein